MCGELKRDSGEVVIDNKNIDTDMNKNLNENDIESIKEEIPLNRIGVSTDIAKCAKWLIEDNYTTGQVININGGWYI